MKTKLWSVVFLCIFIHGIISGQVAEGNQLLKEQLKGVYNNNPQPVISIPVITSPDNLKADCLTCPSYDYIISPLTSYQTHSSSIVSIGCRIYLLLVSANSVYTFKTGCGDGATAAFDTYLELYDGSCNYITGDDDGCESARSIITWTAAYSGYAYLKVRGYNSSYYGSYTLAYKSDPWCVTCPSYDYSISPTGSFQIQSSDISSFGCRIYYMNVTSGNQYTIKTGCGDGASADFDTFLELYNNSCSLIASDDDGCESNRSIINWTATYTGAAYLKVRAYSTYYGNYTLAYRGINPNLCKTCPSYDFTISPTDYFQTHSSSIPSDGCKMYYLNVTSGKEYTFKTGCGDGAMAEFDTYLELYDGSCNLTTYNDDGCESGRSIITWNASYTGVAYLKVRGYNNSFYGSYTLAYKLIQPPNIWLGTVSFQWENGANWNLGHVPSANEDVYITPNGYQPCIIGVSNQQCKSLEIQPGAGLAIDNKELQSEGDITINGLLTMYNNSVIRLRGDWSRNPSTGTFTPGPGKVVFNRVELTGQFCTSEYFNYLELINNWNLILSGVSVTCNFYDWASGTIYLDNSSSFTAYDLVDNGIFGSFSANDGSIINLYNYNGYVDVNGMILITGNSQMNVYGGTTYSYWPYAGNAEITITDGILDFKDQGIFINNDAVGYTLTDNIMGGTIRTSKGFIGNRADFSPSGGTFEFYGTSDYTISQSNGCTLHNVTIDKSAKEGEKTYPTGPLTDEKSGLKISDGGKSNSISLGSDFTITGDLIIDWASTFNLLGYNCDVANTVWIYGSLGITYPTDLTANTINWENGSNDNITNGTIHVEQWFFHSGSLAHLGTGNTAYVTLGILANGNNEFGNLVLALPAKVSNGTINSEKGAYDLNVAGNFTVQSGAGWNLGPDLLVDGNMLIEPAASISFFNDGFDISVVGNAEIAGYIDLPYSDNDMILEGNLIFPSTGSVELNGGMFLCMHPGAATLDGTLIMNSSSLVSFPERSTTIGPNFNDNGITGGTLRFGASLFAPTPGTFQINAANTEFVSLSSSTDEIALASNNWLGNVLIQRSMYIEVTDNLTIKGNLNITDNKLQVNGKILTVEGDITVPHGILSLFTGSQLNIGGSLTVGTFGLFETYGTSVNLNRVFGGSFGYYGLTVNSGGVLRGEYTTFEDMDDHGIWVQSGAIIDPASSLNSCTFKNGAAGGGLLTIENTQSLTIQNPNFPAITPGGGYNVIKTSNTGTIEMNSATGAMAGPGFEYDPYNLVNWTGGMAGLWTGNISSDWFNVNNWSSFNLPDLTVSVLIPGGCPNNPVVTNGQWAYCYILTVDPGASLTIANGKVLSNNNVYISGNLTMTNALGEIQALEVYFQAGSTDNITTGAIRCNYFEFSENTLAKLSGLNTVYCAWTDCKDPLAEYANLHIVQYSKKGNKINGSKTSYTIRVTGDMVMEPGSFYTPYTDLIVTGNSEIQAGATLGDYSGPELGMTCNGNLTIAGYMRLYYSSEVVVHGNLSLTGYLTIFPDCEFTCDYNSASGWTALNGTLDLYPGSDFKITNANVLIGPSFNFTEYEPYGPYFNSAMIFGRTLSAPSPNFQLDYTYISFLGGNTGHYFELNPANYVLDFIVNKYPSGDLYLQSNINVRRAVSIADETILRAYDKTILVGGDWYENYFSGGGGFEPMTGRVILIGDSDQTVYGTADFNILENYNMYGQLVIPTGSTVNCQSYDYTTGGIRVDGGNFTALDMYDSFFDGNNQLTNGTLNISQDALQNLNLRGNLYISGGVMNVTCANGSFSWGFYENCHVAMNSGEMIVNAPEGLAISVNYTGVFSENITGGTIKAYNELDVDNPSFTPAGGTIELLGPGTTLVGMNPSSNVFNLLINKTGTDDSGLMAKYQNKNAVDDGGKANEVRLYSDLAVNGALTVAKGLLDLNGYDVKVSQLAMVNNGGTMEVDAGAALLMGANQTLAVTEGGKLYVVGTSGNEARISRISIGNYTFSVDPGGTIGAQYGIFEYMGINGINIKTGSFVDAAYPFHYCTFRNGIAGGRLVTINNSQNFTVNSAVFPTNTWGGNYNVYKNVTSGTVNFVGATGGFAGAAFEYDPNSMVNWTTLAQTFNLKAYLEGAFNPSSGTMRNDLNTILPLSQPYHPALPYFGNPMPDWYYGGIESVGAIPNSSLVDWVIVQLREGTSPATATTILATQAAFINNSGNIVGLDGTSPLNFTISYSLNLYAVIWHRNHLGIISANPLVNVGGTYTYDFSSGSGQVYGGTSAQKQLATGIWGMMSGDGDGSGGVLTSDRDLVWDIQTGTTGYKASDYNMNRQVNNPDKNDKWLPNVGKGSYIP